MSSSTKMRTELFDYRLPEELIAQEPPEMRGMSRMLVLDRNSGAVTVTEFSALPDFLSSGDCMVFNNTKVIKARFFGIKEGASAKIEALLISPFDISKNIWKSFIKPGKRTKPGTVVLLLKTNSTECGNDSFTVLSHEDDGSYLIRFSNHDFECLQRAYGHMPLPPYIKRPDEVSDSERYQTVFAREPGAVAAPTAGLHFTPEIIEMIKGQGVRTAEVTLHVGPGTFKPVSAENLAEHKMHSEAYSIDSLNAETVNNCRNSGGRVLAVGTTSVRVLESISADDGILKPASGQTEIFIYPPYKPKSVDMLLTNFHLPKSTLLMLVCAFAGRENVLAAYELAIKEKFRFYSYGDCMLLK